MFIFLERDAFSKLAKNMGDEDILSGIGGDERLAVRRPYRGIQIKEDTYASLTIRRSNGRSIPLTSSSAETRNAETAKGITRDYSDFIIQSITDQRVEKQQIIETFGDSFVYFFGERPRIVTVSGLLMNTEDFNWRSQFWENYENHLRGTQLVRANARCYFSYDTIVMEGYPIQAQAADDSNQQYSVPFSMTMFLTNYYDYSSIGEIRFPGFGELDVRTVDAVNIALDQQRGAFTSTTAEVRKKNLEALNSSGGLFDTLRGGIRAINEALAWPGTQMNKFYQALGGRTVRLPIGIAGFIHATGNPQVGSGALGSSAVLSNEGLGRVYDPATGTFKTLTGTVKLRMPGPSKFAPAWTSAVYKGKPRGSFWENIDEYPTALRNSPYDPLDPERLNKGRKRVEDLLNQTDRQAFLERWSARWEMAQTQQVELAKWNLAAESGGFLAGLAESVAFVKSNFGMIMSAAAFVNDPLGVVKASLGIGGGTQSQSRIAGRRDELEKQGIEVNPKAGAGLIEGYIGLKALETFKNMGERIGDGFGPAGPDEPASVGDAYNQSAYEQVSAEAEESGEGFAYEPTYENKNYQELLAQESQLIEGGEQVFTQDLLDEVYGSKDSDATSGEGLDPASLDEVYGTGTTSSSARSPEDIAAILASAQAGGTVNDGEDPSIRGVGSEDGEIKPVI